MTDAYWTAFFKLHQDLPREGPGTPEDVTWAADMAGIDPNARVCDAACGPGADIAALLQVAPRGQISAMDKVAQFVAQAQARHADDPRLSISQGDMAEITGPFDFIWCAGAIYFLGVTEALTMWRNTLAPGGTIAFSQLCWFTDTPSDVARAGWADYADMTDEAGVLACARAASYEVLATKRLSDVAWEAYYAPLDARIAALDGTSDALLQQVLGEARNEAALWRAERESFGYLLCVVRPL
ncbi:MAG: trans-aconitate 2-methyltransferase [Roseobacter sp.]